MYPSSSSSSTTTTTSTSSPASLYAVSEQDIPQLSVSELKRLLTDRQVNTSACFEKSDLIDLAISTKRSLPPEPRNDALVPHLGEREVKDIDYYAVLNITKTATSSEITKAYYKLARENHPDKNPNDPFAEARFKRIGEAYTILSDPEKRERYDKHGMAGVADDFIDPKTLFRMLFGGEKFQDIFGDVAFIDMMENMTKQADPANPNPEEFNNTAYEQTQLARQKQLAHKLLIKLEPYMHAETTVSKKQYEAQIRAEAIELSEVPGGTELLQLVGYVYAQEAKQHMDTLFGIPAFFSHVAEKGHMMKQTFQTISHVVKMQQAQARLERSQQLNGGTPGEIDPSHPDANIVMQEGLKTMWHFGKLEINTTLRTVCESVLQERLPKKMKKTRCKGILLIGETFMQVAKETEKRGSASANLIYQLGNEMKPEQQQPQQPQQQQQQPQQQQPPLPKA
eukprot:TRINITY_DN322_c3_g1_i1.p1 TRINITY_DN322_c3_g1~~TRINITY_DN322_c3_g1_i1.p1  ORF type:complete len:453 (+),score=156.56 TRINITY_DN322_c3_g1_i1:47-1405(+)